MNNYQWLVTPEKCGNVWKIGIQTEDGAIYFSRENYLSKNEALVIANKIYKEEEFHIGNFIFDSIPKNRGNNE
jgi:hypothetical protein